MTPPPPAAATTLAQAGATHGIKIGTAAQAQLLGQSDYTGVQAALYGAVASTCAKQTKCTAIQTWGFTDKYSWIPGFFKGFGWALPFDDKYAKKPAFASYLGGLK